MTDNEQFNITFKYIQDIQHGYALSKETVRQIIEEVCMAYKLPGDAQLNYRELYDCPYERIYHHNLDLIGILNCILQDLNSQCNKLRIKHKLYDKGK